MTGENKELIQVEISKEEGSAIKQGGSFWLWIQRIALARKLAIALAIASVMSGIATYLAMSGAVHFGGPNNNVVVLLNIDFYIFSNPHNKFVNFG